MIAGLQSSGDPWANKYCGEDSNTTSSPGAGTAATSIHCCKSTSFCYYTLHLCLQNCRKIKFQSGT